MSEMTSAAMLDALTETDAFDVLLEVAVVAVAATTPQRTPDEIRAILLERVAERLDSRSRSYRLVLLQREAGL